jgi:hypothetical protein
METATGSRQLILDKLEANGMFKHKQAEWERQARTGCN